MQENDERELRHLFKQLVEILMTIEAKLDQIIAAVSTPPVVPAPIVDFTPVLNAISALAGQVTALQAVVGTEPAPTPVSPPAA